MWNQSQVTPEDNLVEKAIIAVKRDLGAVAKEKRMEAGPARYQYRSIDDVLNKLHGPLCDHGLVIAPRLSTIEQTERGTTSKGTPIWHTRMIVDYQIRVVGCTYELICRTIGEALDSGDKGTNKAATSAFKMLLTQLFAIPFATDDPDDTFAENPAPAQPLRSPQTAAEASDVRVPPTTAGRAAERNTGTIPAVVVQRVANVMASLDARQRVAVEDALRGAVLPLVPDTVDQANEILSIARKVMREHKSN